ncbi:TPA: hypothetical protein RMI67_002391 [Bacillus cereus]|uniref:hypothetical protein n=1 Tax=Bacillus cereus group TaxID=86661 RepID=UPI001F59A6AC|nr:MULTISPECIES: hypothetical protein [Bacillus cereus group]MED3613902.1 hypothetical protein [Bacillus wiedmannii]HDW3054777.1 hypothetical protein [Bacillus cereus]
MPKRWLDVGPKDWFYRAVLETDNMFIDAKKEETLFSGKTYNQFIGGKSRQVHNFTSTEGQTKFEVSGYKPDSREMVFVYIDGVPTLPSKLEDNFIHIGYPLTNGREVSILLSGVVEMHEGDHTPENCQIYPLMSGCSLAYPAKKLEKANNYVFDITYSLNEIAVCMNKKLKRIHVDVNEDESIQDALTRTLGFKRDCFTIINGYLYVSYNLNQFPIYVNYNYQKGAQIKNRQGEKVVPMSSCALYNDRFFPDITIYRGEFFTLLQRLRMNIYNRYTDRVYVNNTIKKTERYIKDKDKIVGKWYAESVLNILDEKFNDGCYVFPLYADDSFQPEVCVTRAEAIVYLHRFTEWALERFR